MAGPNGQTSSQITQETIRRAERAISDARDRERSIAAVLTESDQKALQYKRVLRRAGLLRD